MKRTQLIAMLVSALFALSGNVIAKGGGGGGGAGSGGPGGPDGQGAQTQTQEQTQQHPGKCYPETVGGEPQRRLHKLQSFKKQVVRKVNAEGDVGDEDRGSGGARGRNRDSIFRRV